MRAFAASALRLVKGTFARFAAIASITALGVAVFSGVRATAPNMRDTAQRYFDGTGFMDIRLISTMGFTQGDVDAVRSAPGVLAVSPAWSADASVALRDASLTVKLLSLDASPSGVNRPKLTQGRLPERDGECLADPKFLMLSGLSVGDRLTLDAPDIGSRHVVRGSDFTIVGTAEYPLYISYERGTSAIGTGAVSAYLLLPVSAFSLDVYTDVFVTVENPGALSRFDDGYDALLQPVKDALESLGHDRAAVRLADLRKEANEKLDEARGEVDDGEKELADAERKLGDARREIADGEAELDKAEEDFRAMIADSRTKLADAYAQYSDGVDQWRKNRADVSAAMRRFDGAREELNAAKAQNGLAGRDAGEIEAIVKNLKAQLAMLPPGSPPYLALAAQVQALEALLAGQKQLDAAYTELVRGGRLLEEGRKQLAGTKDEIDRGRRELKDAKAKGNDELAAQRAKLYDAKVELASATEEFDRQKADAQPKLEEAREQISDGERELGELEEPVWYVLDNGTNAGFESFRQDSDRIAAVGVVFPAIFFLVAALVSLTTMTRLVEDERTHIGTLKALGYGRGTVASKYLLYAVAASLLGSAVGLAAGYNLFPRVIFNAYRILYALPEIQPALGLREAVAATAAAVACAALPAWLVCLQSLRAVPASLMLPKAPPAGKRIWLERAGFLWRRMRFTQKVTARNLFRYKKRLFMTIAGVAGCTALTLTGFGLMDSITSIVQKQFHAVRTFDIQVDLRDSEAVSRAELNELLARPPVLESLYLRQQPVDAVFGSGEKQAFLVIPDRSPTMPSFLRLHERLNGNALELSDDSVILSEKLATLYGAKTGDTFRIRDKEGAEKQVRVGGVTENYVYHYIYMSPALYEKLWGGKPEYNQLMCHVDPAGLDAVSGQILKLDAALSLTQAAKLEDNIRKMVGALKAVVAVLIISAALLAFVVLFSLTAINIDERTRELATIKVLGFRNRELNSYIFRENTVLTAIGAAMGLAFGVLLERYVISTSEVDLVMFGRDISWQSFALSALLTFAFAAAVNTAMTLRLKNIEMASTLKGGD